MTMKRALDQGRQKPSNHGYKGRVNKVWQHEGFGNMGSVVVIKTTIHDLGI